VETQNDVCTGKPVKPYYKRTVANLKHISVITNIYNKKTTGPTLMELFTAIQKLKKFFLTTRGVWCVQNTWHGTHWYDTKVLATWPHRHGSLQQWRILMHPCWSMCGKNLNIVSMCAVSPVVHPSNISSCQKKLFQFSAAVINSIKVHPLVFLL
jgi:hypothetical protein